MINILLLFIIIIIIIINIGMIPYIKKLDSVLVTKKELDNSLVWKTKFNMINPPLPKINPKPDYDIQY